MKRVRLRISRVCHDCGSHARETPFPGTRKPLRQVDRCVDCAAEHARRAEVSPAMERLAAATARLVACSIQTRASYRAAYRHRLAQPQGDLVDLLVATP